MNRPPIVRPANSSRDSTRSSPQSRYKILGVNPMNSEFRRPQLQNPMNVTLLKALVGLVPTSILFSYSAVLFLWRKTADSLLQLLGAACLVIVVLTHVAEALRWLPWMGWGSPNSVGHYLDLYSAVLGLTLFLIGYLLRNRPIEIGILKNRGGKWTA